MRKVDIVVPESIEELISVLKESDDSKILAGGTDIVVDIKKGKCNAEKLIDISHIKGFKGIEKIGEDIHIGSLTTFSDLVSSEIIRNELTPLYEASGMVGSLQIRNVATIGGNIVNRASAADGVNALLVLGADLSILGSDGEERLVSMEEFLKSGIDSKDVLKEIIIKPLNDGYKGAFTKVGNRSRVTVSQVILSGVCKVEGDVVIDLKLALGAVGSYSFIPLEVCNWSKGQVVDGEFKRLLEDKLSAAIEGSIPDRSSMPYKRVAVKGLLDNIYSKLFE